jgi:hypothetical protein
MNQRMSSEMASVTAMVSTSSLVSEPRKERTTPPGCASSRVPPGSSPPPLPPLPPPLPPLLPPAEAQGESERAACVRQHEKHEDGVCATASGQAASRESATHPARCRPARSQRGGARRLCCGTHIRIGLRAARQLQERQRCSMTVTEE